MTERRKLVREEAAPVRARRPRDDDGREGADRDRGGDPEPRERGGRARWTRGRPSLAQDYGDVSRGTFFVGVESAAIALDTMARVLRAAVDRAFDEDYENPGDLVRGVASEADLAAYDLATELRGVPRRLSRRFDDAVRSPRADRGERERREAARTGRADREEGSGSNGDERPLRPRRDG
jgi:hypothetical protein